MTIKRFLLGSLKNEVRTLQYENELTSSTLTQMKPIEDSDVMKALAKEGSSFESGRSRGKSTTTSKNNRSRSNSRTRSASRDKRREDNRKASNNTVTTTASSSDDVHLF